MLYRDQYRKIPTISTPKPKDLCNNAKNCSIILCSVMAMAIIEGVSGKGGHVPFYIFHFLKIRMACFNHVNNVFTK